jgi:transcriptional antiterminator NusG
VVEPAEPKSENMNWYILKVQSNREESIREGLLRRVAIAGLGRFFGDVIVPTEKVTEFKGGKKRVIKRKLYPGYLVVNMEINEDTWYMVRETPGIGDFTGATSRGAAAQEPKATPMLPHEVARIVAKQEEKSEKAPKLKIGVAPGERVKINEGTFENFEGEVESIDETNGRVTVMINIFGRSTPVELEYWQIEAV